MQATSTPRLTVTFQSNGRSGRQWTENFELGSADANALKALEIAWKKDAHIVASVEQQ